MNKVIAFLVVLLFPTTIVFATNIEEYLIGRDLAAGPYTAELYATEEDELIGVAICTIMRSIDGSYKMETIQTADMTLTNNHTHCDLDLQNGDRLMIGCSDGYAVMLINLTGAEIEDKYPNAIEDVNLTKAINATLTYLDDYALDFKGLNKTTIEYDKTLPSINITMFYDSGHKMQYKEHLKAILWRLNESCANQNEKIARSTPLSYGGIYDNLTVIVGIYDDLILYADTSFETYFILPATNEIIEYK